MASTVADYQNRIVDMGAFQGVFPNAKTQLLVQQLVGSNNSGVLVAGIQKLAQQVLIVLLTKQGSQPYRPAYGTTFMVDADLGMWRQVADVEQSFYAARVDLRRQLQAEEVAATPLDERYGTLELSGVTLAGDRVTIRLTLTSQAGTTYTYLTPITVSIS